MTGCLRRIGCLVLLLLVAAGAAWYWRDRWLPYWHRLRPATAPVVAADSVRWEPLTPQGAARARDRVHQLSLQKGPAFVSVDPADLSAYVFEELAKQLPPSAENLEAAVIGRELHIRGDMDLNDFGGRSSLGPLGSMLGGREPVEFAGDLTLLRRGMAQYEVTMLRIKDFSVPKPLIPKLVRGIERGTRPAGLADAALPLVVPSFIGDIRVGTRTITLYRAAPE